MLHVRPGRRALLAICAVLLAGRPAGAPAASADGPAPATAVPAAGQGGISEREVAVRLPAVSLVREDGRSVQLAAEIDDGRPVLVNFIYTSCFGICPMSSQTFAQFQARLGADAARVHLVSVSIDPEEDTPPVLRDYARRYHAGAGWNHYTGTVAASIATQKAFDVYRGDKMNHEPVTLVRAAPGRPWVRIEGFATAADLLRVYHRLAGSGAPKARQGGAPAPEG